MLKKLRILIYKNWFIVLASSVTSFFMLKNIFIGIFIAFFVYWQIRGSAGQAFFFSCLFLPIFLTLIRKIEIINFYWLTLFFINYLILKKQSIIDWLILVLILFSISYLNFLEDFGLAVFIILGSFIVFAYSWLILKFHFFNSLIVTLIFFELIFVTSFLPFSFWWRTSIPVFLIILLLKFANVIISNNGISTNRS